MQQLSTIINIYLQQYSKAKQKISLIIATNTMPPKRKAHPKTRTQMLQQPFPHMIVNNFLSDQLYSQTLQIYNKLQFKQKISDLFHFFQTNQLNKHSPLDYFKAQLDTQFWSLPPMNQINSKGQPKVKKQQTFYNVFASYYFQGDYLLCHDDIIQDRIYAFSYYLQDHDSADLVFFNKDANQQVKRVKVKKNTLAIFKVCNTSYHEVDYCKSDGRKAITGWFNIRNSHKSRIQKTIAPYIPKIQVKNTLQYPLPAEYITQQFFQLMDIQYQFNVKKTWIQGPFFQRRVHKIQIKPVVIFTLPGYKLYTTQFYHFKEGDYILLNDPVNKLKDKGQNIIDVFVTSLPKNFQYSEDQLLVKIAQPDQEQCGIPEQDDCLFIVQRGKKQYYVERREQNKGFMLAHFIYVEEDKKPQKNTKKQKKATIVPKELQKQNKKSTKQTNFKTNQDQQKNKKVVQGKTKAKKVDKKKKSKQSNPKLKTKAQKNKSTPNKKLNKTRKIRKAKK